ncbi:MAG: hypothetical protein WCG87_03465 [Bacteroidota bacterium]
MTDIEFIKSIVELYRKARLTFFPAGNIKRGKSHTISSQVEDLFALYISDIVNSKIEILIDQPISFSHNNVSKTIYADIAMIKDDLIYQIWDIKTDLGWKRDIFPQFCKDKDELVNSIKSKDAKFKNREDNTSRQLKFSSDFTFNIVVISCKNISTIKHERVANETRQLQNVGVYFLTSDTHPNSNYDDDINDLIKKINFNDTDFILLRHRIENDKL